MTCKILFSASLSEPQILDKPEAVYIYLCVILHSNHSMCMLRYHVVDCLLRLAKVVINAVDESRSRGSAVWLELKDDKNVHHGACYWVTFNQSYLFISSWSHGSGNHSQLA